MIITIVGQIVFPRRFMIRVSQLATNATWCTQHLPEGSLGLRKYSTKRWKDLQAVYMGMDPRFFWKDCLMKMRRRVDEERGLHPYTNWCFEHVCQPKYSWIISKWKWRISSKEGLMTRREVTGCQTNGSEHVSAKTSVNEEFPKDNEKDSPM